MKPFDPELYDRDDAAKDYLLTWLNAKGYAAQVNPDPFGIDLLLRFAQVEVEVKQAWQGFTFPFKTIHVSARKLKFATRTSFLAMLNRDWTAMIVITGRELLQANRVKKDTIYTKAEEFLEVSGERKVWDIR